MDRIILILTICLTPISIAKSLLANLDVNTTGKDDKVASFLGYVESGIKAILSERPLPSVPQELK